MRKNNNFRISYLINLMIFEKNIINVLVKRKNNNLHNNLKQF